MASVCLRWPRLLRESGTRRLRRFYRQCFSDLCWSNSSSEVSEKGKTDLVYQCTPVLIHNPFLIGPSSLSGSICETLYTWRTKVIDIHLWEKVRAVASKGTQWWRDYFYIIFLNHLFEFKPSFSRPCSVKGKEKYGVSMSIWLLKKVY